MKKKPKYPPDDPDRKLALYLDSRSGTGLEDRSTHESSEKPSSEDSVVRKDPLLHFLETYKSNSELKITAEAAPRIRENVMNYVERDNIEDSKRNVFDGAKRVDENSNKRHQNTWIRPTVLWRIAAVLIAVSFLSLYYLLSVSDQPELLAESGISQKEWVFLDGSRVTLRPHSVLYRITEKEDVQRYAIMGEGYFEVQSNVGREFIVQTGEAKVRVTGTRFTIRSWDDITHVFLEEGSIMFSRDDHTGETPIFPGQFSTVREGHVSEPQEVAKEVYLGWLNDLLVLDSRPLLDITREISHHFDITINLSESLRDTRLSGTLLLDDPIRILDDLAISLGAEVLEITPDHFRIFESDLN